MSLEDQATTAMQQLVNLSLYHEVQEILRPKFTMKKIGTESVCCPQYPIFPELQYDEVYPNLYLGSARIVKNYEALKSLGVTHLVNCCMGPKFHQVNTNMEFYEIFDIEFHGVPAIDEPSFKLLPYLRDAAAFIEQALDSGCTVYVHCRQGVSRSATVVLAFLMLTKGMDILTATKYLRSKREVMPNDGFLWELCELQDQIDSLTAKGATAEQVQGN